MRACGWSLPFFPLKGLKVHNLLSAGGAQIYEGPNRAHCLKLIATECIGFVKITEAASSFRHDFGGRLRQLRSVDLREVTIPYMFPERRDITDDCVAPCNSGSDSSHSRPGKHVYNRFAR